MIEVSALEVRIGATVAVASVEARFDAGRLYGVVGPNGSGKTTLIRALTGLLTPEAGEVRVEGHDVASLSLAQRAARIGYLPQERTIAWDLSVAEIVRLGTKDGNEAVVGEVLTQVGLETLANRGVFSLSGGQRARALLGRLLATRCPVLLLDEPLMALDPAWQRQVLLILKDMAARGHTVIASLHDLGLAAQFCDAVCVMRDGRVAAFGAPEQAFTPEVLAEVFGLSGELRTEAEGLALHLAARPL
ncbi:ABC transporter ATP-binding protein [Asticcacaulis sp. BYS171W]|uniref:ABC transporter ATP-binding protein n=1 Tax=Asticcacaulis aquaticus TaxID=2984212 RepID=A0ABT5HPE0_9CAUL|nr:ABC transporter ATP-binding protein [Asticcacaulis aquaticus]MDC7681932.1 ABC transporter ATP-binding protein [Asticcacaulis aquaticus]